MPLLLNRQLRKAVMTKGSFPGDDAARKLMYVAIQNAAPHWTSGTNPEVISILRWAES